MWEWIIGALLGFLGELVRSLYADYTASRTLQENGRLKEQVRAHNEAQAIKDRINAETDLGAVIEGL